jgi:integrase|tara:strand:+ start:805 stop:2049 length:1245 start_codon:yes stop_codon:yes gene_type:complete
MPGKKITKRSVDAVKADLRDQYLWDQELKGFGLKVTPAGRKVYLVQYRLNGRSGNTRRVTIGQHGSPWTSDQARTEAGKILAQVRLGKDPASAKQKANKEPTVGVICDAYLEEYVATKYKASTAAQAIRLIKTRVKPEFENFKISEFTRGRINRWHKDPSRSLYESNRALDYLSSALTFAMRHERFEDYIDTNPCKSIERHKEKARDEFFSDDELDRIGNALRKLEEAEKAPRGCADTIRLLALTGLRRGEALTLEWDDVDFETGSAGLRDTKTGDRTHPLGAPALALLNGLERHSKYVICGPDPSKPVSKNTLQNFWSKVREEAEIKGARLHDFRHTAGTFAAFAGHSAFQVRNFLGHKTLAMSNRYVGRAVEETRTVADAVGERVDAAMSGSKVADVVDLKAVGASSKGGSK